MQFLLAFLLQFQAVGLEAGESFRELAKAPAAQSTRSPLHGRVLDAFTGWPVAGAKIETWTEEIDEGFAGFHRIGETRSRSDGRFTICQQQGGVFGEKARVSAAGYLTWSGTRGDLMSVLRIFPRMKESPRVRVVDLGGRPIAGARITTTYTCAHDVPAFDLRTGVDGSVELAEYGLQDDVQQLRVRAAGFAAIKYVDGDALFSARCFRKPLEIMLPRQNPSAVRILSREGDVLRDRSVRVTDGDGYHVSRTDKEGRIEIRSRYGCGELNLQLLGRAERKRIAFFTPPRARVPSLRIYAVDWPDETKTGTVQIDLSAAKARKTDEPKMQLFHEDGWFADITGEPDDDTEDMRTSFPAGRGYLVIGGAFSGYAEEIHDFELEAGKNLVIKPRFVSEPRIRVLAPKTGEWTLTIQAGSYSKHDLAFDTELSVPEQRELMLYVEGDGHCLCKTVRNVVSGMTIDLSNELDQLAGRKKKPVLVTQEIRFVSAQSGRPLRGSFALRYGEGCKRQSPEDTLGDHFEVRGPLGNEWLGYFEAKGHNPIYVRGRLNNLKRQMRKRLDAYAKLTIDAPFAFEILGDDALDLDALERGPLDLVLLHGSGRRFGLHLVIKPGATRKISILRHR